MAVRIILQCPGFFFIPLKQIEIESSPVTGRVYFLHRGRIVAVGVKSDGAR